MIKQPSITFAAAVLLLVGLAPSGAAQAPVDAEAVRFSASLSLSPRSIDVGERSIATGHVTPSRPGHDVILETRRGGQWRNVEVRELDGSSDFRFVIEPASNGVKTFRVRVPALGQVSEGVSPSRKLSVYTWTYLSDLDPIDSDGTYAGPARINGRLYPHSLYGKDTYAFGPWFREFDIRRDCTALKASGGLKDDRSGPGDLGLAEVLLNGVPISSEQYSFAETYGVKLNVRDGLQLRVVLDPLEGSPAVALGNARIRCTF